MEISPWPRYHFKMDIPKGYTSKDVIDRRHGEKPTLLDRTRDALIATRNDYNEMKANERRRSGKPDPDDQKKVGNKIYPAFKNGGTVRKTGLAYVHKGERIAPAPSSRKRIKKEMKKRS